ncbi:MAG TPA: M13 family metallopeptidase N-terminal domain-containing protein [Acidobacteriaceae bacterium]|nr:M13 family metallopeptidase N-terminal domain-containing protein [Acidobacteriaceae bacterium]
MRVVSSACVALLSGAGTLFAQQVLSPADTASSQNPVEPKAPRSFDLGAIDKSVDPCADFYQYACGNWRKNNPIPADPSRWGRFNELSERNRYLLYVDLKKAADSPSSPLQRKYGGFFTACMNSDLADQLGDKPIQPALARVAAIHDKKQLAAVVACLEARTASSSFFRFGVEQDQKDSTKEIEAVSQAGISLPDRDSAATPASP